MQITRASLLRAIKLKPFVVNVCSMCGYRCRYEYRSGKLGYDSGCFCISYENWTPCEEIELDFYLDPQYGWQDKLTAFIEDTFPRGLANVV